MQPPSHDDSLSPASSSSSIASTGNVNLHPTSAAVVSKESNPSTAIGDSSVPANSSSSSPSFSSVNDAAEIDPFDSSSIVRTDSGLGRRQLFAMLRKNYLLKRRAWCQTLCECIAPIFLTVMILLGQRLAADSATVTPPTIYANQTIDLSGIIINATSFLQQQEQVNPTNSRSVQQNARSLTTILRNVTDSQGPLPVPTFDMFVGAHTYLHDILLAGNSTTLQSVNRLSIADSRFNVLVNLGKLSFAPDKPEVRQLVQQLNLNNREFNSTFDKIYPTEDAAIDYALRDFTLDPDFNQRDPYKLRSWAVIVFDELDFKLGRFDYTIRMNYSVIPDTRRTSIRFAKGFSNIYQRYFLSGYLTLQMTIEQALVDVIRSISPAEGGFQLLGNNYNNISSSRTSFGRLMTAPMPVEAQYVNSFYTSSGPFVGLVLCLSLLYPVSRLIKQLVEDKETRMRETLSMMGLYRWVFVTSYGITYFFIFSFIALVQTILMGSSVMSNSDNGLLFIYFWFFAISMLCFSFLISVFFSKAKLAGIVGPIITFAAVMPRYAFLTTADEDQTGAKFFCSILSPTAFAFAMDQYMLYEGAQVGVTRHNAGDEPVSVSAMIAFMFFDSVLYAFLAWFLEQVLPNEYGTSRPVWFLFTKDYWRETTSQKSSGTSAQTMIAELDQHYAPHVDGKYVEPIRSTDLKASVIISHLHKVFTHGNSVFNFLTNNKAAEVVAVKDLNLTMYEGQITALLGHNGAGKSTTISMLTGLYKPSGGNCWMNGLTIRDNMHEIRHHLGICPQHNVLMESLTVSEHLELVAVLKGTPRSLVKKAVTDMIANIGLQAKTNVYSSKLSGGMKRRLQCGMALIGDSKIVFLDEPTSGMDPYSRRSTWEMLKRAKRGRVIVLTTHFMDEADLLGDRIAIIAAGQLRAAGSSLFLKNKFGIGYNLTLVYQKEDIKQLQRTLRRRERERRKATARAEKQQRLASHDTANPAALVPLSQPFTQPLLERAHVHDGHEIARPISAVKSNGDVSSPSLPAGAHWTMDEVHRFIQAYIPAASSLSQAAGEISFQLPLDSVANFSTLFAAIDQRKGEMGISGYGVSMTTLEEVFIKIAHEDLHPSMEKPPQQQNPSQATIAVMEDNENGHSASNAKSAPIVVRPKKMIRRRRRQANEDDKAVLDASPQPGAVGSNGIELADMSLPHPPSGLMSSAEGMEVAASANMLSVNGDRHSLIGLTPSPIPPSVSPFGPHTGEGIELNNHDGDDGEWEDVWVYDDGTEAVEGTNGVLPSPNPSISPLSPDSSPTPATLKNSSILGPLATKSQRHTAPMPKQVWELMRKRYLCAKRDLWGRFFEVILPVCIVAIVLLILTIEYNPAGPSIHMSPALYQRDPGWLSPSQIDASNVEVQSYTTVAPTRLRSNLVRHAAAAARQQHSSSHVGRQFSIANLDPIPYYPSSTLAYTQPASQPTTMDYGLLCQPLTNTTDRGMIYALGMSNPADREGKVYQPYTMRFYPNVSNSLNMSIDLLADITTHPGLRVGSWIFSDPIRLFAPLTDEAIEAGKQFFIAEYIKANPNQTTVRIPLMVSVDGVLQPINIVDLEEFLSGTGSTNTTTIAIPGIDLPVTAIVAGSDLILNLPTAGGDGIASQIQINLNDLTRNFTQRINGTDEFRIIGTNITIDTTPGTIGGDVTNLNLTQFLDALRQTFPNTTTVPDLIIPQSTFIALVNSTDPAVYRQLAESIGLGLNIEPVTLLHNVTLYHSIPAFAADLFRARVTLLYNGGVQSLSTSDNFTQYSEALPPYVNRVSYNVHNHPLPLTTQSILQIRAVLAIFAALFVLIPFSYLPASFVIFVVKERSSKAKHLQLVSGVNPFAYWVSTYAFDMINYFVVCVAVMIVFLGYNNESFSGDAETAFATFLLFFLYGCAVIPLSYSISFIFQNHTAAQVGIASILFVLGFVLTIGSFIMSNIDTTKDTNATLIPFYRLSPPFCLGEGLINLATRALTNLVTGEKANVWSYQVTGRQLVYLACETVGYFIITLLIEFSVLRRLYKLCLNQYLHWTGAGRSSELVKKRDSSASTVSGSGSRVGQLEVDMSEEIDESRDSRMSRSQSLVQYKSNEPALPSVLPAVTSEEGQQHTQQQQHPAKLFTSRSPSNSQRHNLPLADKQSPRSDGRGFELGVAPPEMEGQFGPEMEMEMEEKQNSNTHGTAAVAGDSKQQSVSPLSDSVNASNPDEDDDVIAERLRVESGDADSDLIVIKHLRKTFGWDGKLKFPCFNRTIQLPFFGPPMVAVKDLCLSVPAGQCFGFLGINGAGKTTSMAMLTGELEPSGGRAYLSSYDIGTEMEKIRQTLGFCPQFDPLLDLLTAREHLTMYGRIRGIPEAELTPLVQHLIDKLGLKPFADNITKSYSGGNMRKCSLALALIGNPSVVFLDEPSTGMDPVSRRFMWDIIADLSKSMSVVLTTHSMEECEALCSRIGIMVNGALACIGSLEHLKQKYGKGFHIELNTSESRVVDVREFIHTIFPSAEEQEEHAGRLKYIVPRHEAGISLADIFAKLEERKSDLSIHDYAVSGGSLEQIFVNIARGRDQAQAEARAQHNDKREAKMK